MFSKEKVIEIVSKHEKKLDGINYLIYCNENTAPKKMLVSFSSMGSTNYSRISWFCEQSNLEDYAFLFLYDNDNQFYQGSKNFETFKKIIFRSMSNYDIKKEHVYTVGNSMGGTAAIYYATLLGLNGAIAANPQFNIKLSAMHTSPSWVQCMKKSKEFKSIEDILDNVTFLPKIFIEYSSYLPDFYAAQEYIKIWTTYGGFIIAHHNRIIEHATDAPNKNKIISTIDFLESITS